jgi:hypothetical protein
MVYSSLPLWGPKARILPSLQPLMMDLPSCMVTAATGANPGAELEDDITDATAQS